MKTTTAWANLPNAKHIDWVLADVALWPDEWERAWKIAQGAHKNKAHWNAWFAARGAVWENVRRGGRQDAWFAVRQAAEGAATGGAQHAALDAIAALIAWDDSSLLLDMPVRNAEPKAPADSPDALLLLPAVIVKNTKE